MKVNGTKPKEKLELEDGNGQDQEPDTPVEEVLVPDQGPHTPRSELPNGRLHTNGALSKSDQVEQSIMPGKESGTPEDTGTETDEVAESLKSTLVSRAPRNSISKSAPDDTEARLEALAQERAALKDQVAELRRSLEEIQEKHEEDVHTIRGQLDERNAEKEHAETQYRNLLGKVNTIRSQLGERLKADAVSFIALYEGRGH